jgi:predicted acyltransferase
MPAPWSNAETGRERAAGVKQPGSSSARVDSVDALRGLTILLMVFVNDLGHAAPAWMHHIRPPNADGMTLADIVFPSFLFIVGVSIPLAQERAAANGKSKSAQLGHILMRTAAVLFMGVIYINEEADLRPGTPLWGLLAFSALILAWCTVPREPGWKRTMLLSLKTLGIWAIVILLAIFRRAPANTTILFWGEVHDWTWLRPGWWEILGLIGWAYLAGALVALFLGKRREWLMGAMAILMLLHIALHKGGLFARVGDKTWLAWAGPALDGLSGAIDDVGKYVSLRDALGSLAAVTLAGCVLGSILRHDSDVSCPRARVGWALTFAAGLFLAGVVTDTLEGINKIGATPTWCFWCAALATVVWLLLYLVIDVAGLKFWALPIRPAGANPLVAYFLHPITLWVLSLAGLEEQILAYKDSTDPGVVVGGSAAMALFVCTAAGLLGRLGLRMRL